MNGSDNQFSTETRAKMAAAQKARWAKRRAENAGVKDFECDTAQHSPGVLGFLTATAAGEVFRGAGGAGRGSAMPLFLHERDARERFCGILTSVRKTVLAVRVVWNRS